MDRSCERFRKKGCFSVAERFRKKGCFAVAARYPLCEKQPFSRNLEQRLFKPLGYKVPGAGRPCHSRHCPKNLFYFIFAP